ncbi:MAG: hypothetical protein GTO12_16140 [Proteobacteria bacterium]|nr:hypothetical protein [Pseudomonadota bacterium]
MIGFYEVLDRTMPGKYRPEADFEMNRRVPKIQEVVSKYKIIYDPENPQKPTAW